MALRDGDAGRKTRGDNAGYHQGNCTINCTGLHAGRKTRGDNAGYHQGNCTINCTGLHG